MKMKTKKMQWIIILFLVINNILYSYIIINYIRAFFLLIYDSVLIAKISFERRKILNHTLVIVVLFLISELVTTIMGNQNVFSYIGSALVVFTPLLMLYICQTQDFKLFLIVMSEVLLFVLIINGICILMFPGGISETSNGWGWSEGRYLVGQPLNYFLLLVASYISTQSLFCLYGIKRYRIINAVIIFIYIILNTFWMPKVETTAVLMCIVLIFGIMLTSKKKKKKIISVTTVIAITAVIYIGIVFSNIILNNIVVSYFIEDILGKSTNLTGRTYIWANALRMIEQSPVFGYGVGAQVTTYIYDIAVSEHNQILHILVEGGMFSLILFLAIIVSFALSLFKTRNNLIRNSFIVSYIAIAICFLTIAYGLASSWEFYYIMVLACYIANVQRHLDERFVN